MNVFLTLIILLQMLVDFGSGIGCFVCSSIGGSNPSCEDTFHFNDTNVDYHTNCMAGRKGRDGLYPGSSCTKLSGTIIATGELVVVRGCSLDSGSTTADTEIVRISNCGAFQFEDQYLSGCVMSCNNNDGCNTATTVKFSFIFNLLIVFSGVFPL